MKNRPIDDPNVLAVFNSYPKDIRSRLMQIRKWIFDVAETTEGVGKIEETLKWGQPSYLTVKPKSGTTIRIDQLRDRGGEYAMYFHCQTTLVDTFREIYRNEFRFEGNRALLFHVGEVVPEPALRHCIAMALTYHLNKA